MPFVGDRRVKWVLEEYEAYRKKYRRGKIMLVATVTDIVVAELVSSILPIEFRYTIVGTLGILALGLLFLGSRAFNEELEYYLPKIEDRLLCFLKPAADALAAHDAYHRLDDKEKALKNLRQVADLLDKWFPGNLQFVKEGRVGTMLREVQANFRYGFLPALRDAKEPDVRSLLVVVENMERTLELNASISEETLEVWNRMLSRYAEGEHPKRFWRKIPTKRSHVLTGLTAIAPTTVIGVF